MRPSALKVETFACQQWTGLPRRRVRFLHSREVSAVRHSKQHVLLQWMLVNITNGQSGGGGENGQEGRRTQEEETGKGRERASESERMRGGATGETIKGNDYYEKIEAEELEETTTVLAAVGIDVPAGGRRGAVAVAGQPAESDYNTPDEVATRIRAINKGLKSAIQQRDAKAKGMQLNEDQETKIAAIPEIEKELAEMEAKLKSLH